MPFWEVTRELISEALEAEYSKWAADPQGEKFLAGLKNSLQREKMYEQAGASICTVILVMVRILFRK